MLLDLLRADATLTQFICQICSENGISVEIHPDIDKNTILILKPDAYYNHIIKAPDKSPDCLIIQRCSDNTYRIFIIELRNIKNQAGFSVDDMVEKFNTCLDDFMSQKFGNYFHNALFNYTSIKLYFISDPYNFKADPEKQLKMRGHKFDMLIAQRIPKYFGKHLYIEPKLPSPTILPC